MVIQYTISRHAQLRRKQMGVTEHRIQAVLQDPDTIYPADPHHRNRDRRMCYQGGDLVIVVDEPLAKVITVLWHGRTGR